jgi:methionine synthase II (cobalamin-independent)
LGINIGIQMASKTSFQADHLGSLLRPFQLLETRAAVEKKQPTQKELSSVQGEYTKQIVQTQLDLWLILSPMANTDGICSSGINLEIANIIN